jgi:hypothetical protein
LHTQIQARRLAKLVDDVADAVAFDQGKVPMFSEDVFDIKDLVAGLCEELRYSCKVFMHETHMRTYTL